MSKYRKKPVVIEAAPVNEVLYNAGHGWKDLPSWVIDAYEEGTILFEPDRISIRTLEGIMSAMKGDMLIRGVRGELYPCKPDIFEATYEPA